MFRSVQTVVVSRNQYFASAYSHDILALYTFAVLTARCAYHYVASADIYVIISLDAFWRRVVFVVYILRAGCYYLNITSVNIDVGIGADALASISGTLYA